MELKFKKYKMPNDTVVSSIDISADDKMLAVGQQSAEGDKPSLTFWQFTADEIKPIDNGLCFEEANMITNLNFCNHNKYLVFNDIMVYSFDDQSYKKKSFNIREVEYIKSSKNNPYILVSGSEIKIFDLENNRLVWSYNGEIKFSTVKIPTTISCITEDFSRAVISGTESQEVLIYDINENKILKKLANGPVMAGKVLISNDFKYILSTGYLGEGLYLWDYNQGDRVLTDIIKEHTTSAVSFINSSYLVVGGYSGHIFIIDIDKRCYGFYKSIHDGKITDIKINYTKKIMVVSSEDGYISLFDISVLI